MVTETKSMFSGKQRADRLLFMDEGFTQLCCGVSKHASSADHVFKLAQLNAIR
jgi:hypothetical protein